MRLLPLAAGLPPNRGRAFTRTPIQREYVNIHGILGDGWFADVGIG